MTAENPETVLENDDGPDIFWAGSLTLIVAFVLTVIVVATTESIEMVLLTALIWVLGTALRLAEVTQT